MELVRYCLPSLLAGSIAGLLAVAAILALDIGGIRDLMQRDPSGGIALFLMCFGFVVTFGSAALGAAIMAIGSEDE
jgi:hypothetical protein